MTSDARPRRLVVVVGTGTDVGKTWVGAATLAELRRRGLRVAARKPVQSFEVDDTTTDASVLAGATGEPIDAVCPPHRCYEIAWAPPMAAAELGRPSFTLADLVAEITWPDGVDVGLVETAGGVRSPLASDDGDALDLIARLAPDAVVLVADAGLGTLNSVRLTLAAMSDGHPSRFVVLNRFDPADRLHQLNLEWLRGHLDVEVVTSPAGLADRLA